MLRHEVDSSVWCLSLFIEKAEFCAQMAAVVDPKIVRIGCIAVNFEDQFTLMNLMAAVSTTNRSRRVEELFAAPASECVEEHDITRFLRSSASLPSLAYRESAALRVAVVVAPSLPLPTALEPSKCSQMVRCFIDSRLEAQQPVHALIGIADATYSCCGLLTDEEADENAKAFCANVSGALAGVANAPHVFFASGVTFAEEFCAATLLPAVKSAVNRALCVDVEERFDQLLRDASLASLMVETGFRRSRLLASQGEVPDAKVAMNKLRDYVVDQRIDGAYLRSISDDDLRAELHAAVGNFGVAESLIRVVRQLRPLVAS